MKSEDLANAVESVVLKVVQDNFHLILIQLNQALDSELPDAVYFVERLKSKMPTTPPPTPLTAAPVVQIADAQVSEFTKALQSCLTGTRAKFVDALVANGLATEDFCDEKATEIVEDKMGEYCDEDQVKELINGAWNGA